MQHKALILEDIHPIASQMFKDVGIEVETLSHGLNPEQLQAKLSDHTILAIRAATQITPEILQNSELKIIGSYTTGINQIDLEACMQKSIAVFNAAGISSTSVVELAIGYIIALLRNVIPQNNLLHSGIWHKTTDQSFQLQGKTLGIVGYGKIGSELSKAAQCLNLNVRYFDLVEREPIDNAQPCKSLQELLSICDILSIHVDGRGSNKHLIGETELGLMKPGSYIINLSRGNIVDESSLANAIKTGNIAGAAIDVFAHEPTQNGPGFTSPLQHLPNVILTPHIGASTIEAQIAIAEIVTNHILDYISTSNPQHSLTPLA